MSQHKKKPGAFQRDKILKAQQKNEFMRKIKFIMDAIYGEGFYAQIPRKRLKELYVYRCHSIKIIAANGHQISNFILDNAKAVLPPMLKRTVIPFSDAGNTISINDFFTVFYTLVGFNKRIEGDSFINNEKERMALKSFDSTIKKIQPLIMEKLYMEMQLYGAMISNFQHNLYWLKYDTKLVTTLACGVEFQIEIYKYHPERDFIRIDGISRPAIRLVWASANIGLNPIFLKASQLQLKTSFTDLSLEVFIQSHALQRLSERIDCFLPEHLHFSIFISLTDPKIIQKQNNSILIEYRFISIKVGYFLADILDGKVVIRTFLFLTNIGTPEGNRLKKITGLNKPDMHYLSIDKLSTFMSTDINDDPEIKEIFKKAGCESIVIAYEGLKKLSIKSSHESVATLIHKYLSREPSESETKIASYRCEEMT